MIFTRGSTLSPAHTNTHAQTVLRRVTTLDTSDDHVSAPAHALTWASSGLTRRARRPAQRTASWLPQRPAARLPLAPLPRREAEASHLLPVDWLEEDIGLLLSQRLDGEEGGQPPAE